jgi:DNA-binding MarR family transcriptional regulator
VSNYWFEKELTDKEEQILSLFMNRPCHILYTEDIVFLTDRSIKSVNATIKGLVNKGLIKKEITRDIPGYSLCKDYVND